MIVEMKTGASQEEVDAVVAKAKSQGLDVQLNLGTDNTVVALLGSNTGQLPTDIFAVLPGVESVHDLHIWAMSTTETALTAHLVKPNSADDDALIEKASEELHDRFGIEHITLQWERWHELDHCGGSCEIEN